MEERKEGKRGASRRLKEGKRLKTKNFIRDMEKKVRRSKGS